MEQDPNSADQPPPQPPPASNAQPNHHHKIPGANWPSIKILQPPKGIYSPRPDERCLTYCSQTIAGRIANREPWCRSICIRKVFAHEVRNVTAFKYHRNTLPNGQAKYPLPPEGHRLPDILGGAGEVARDVKHWEEGWYLWFSKSRWAALERLDLMSFDLERQTNWLLHKEQRKKQWDEWQEYERRRYQDGPQSSHDTREEPSLHNHDSWHSPPPRPFPDTVEQSLLLHLPPPLPPIYEKVQTLLAPTHNALEIFRESIDSGAQRQFAILMWQKAWTGEPFRLVSTVCSQMWEKWKEGPPEDPDRTGGV